MHSPSRNSWSASNTACSRKVIVWRFAQHDSLDGRGGLLASARWHTRGNARLGRSMAQGRRYRIVNCPIRAGAGDIQRDHQSTSCRGRAYPASCRHAVPPRFSALCARLNSAPDFVAKDSSFRACHAAEAVSPCDCGRASAWLPARAAGKSDRISHIGHWR